MGILYGFLLFSLVFAVAVNGDERFSGAVSWFNEAKGYGFITRDDTGADVFVESSAIQKDGFRTLTAGEAVEFSVVSGQSGSIAVDVTGPGGVWSK